MNKTKIILPQLFIIALLAVVFSLPGCGDGFDLLVKDKIIIDETPIEIPPPDDPVYEQVHITYTQNDGSSTRLYYLKSDDNGESFSNLITIDLGTGTYLRPEPKTHSLKVDGDGNPHVVFVQDDGSSDMIYYTYSTDGGVTFEIPVALESGGFDVSLLALELDSNDNPHVAFLSTAIYYRKSLNGGNSFENEIRLDDPALTSPGNLEMALDSNGNPHVTFTDFDATRRTYYVRSSNGGSSFTTPVLIDSGDSYFSWGESIRIDSNNNPHIVFSQTDVTGDKRLYYNYSTDGGSTFEGALIIDGAPGEDIVDYRFKLDSYNNPHIVFRDNTVGGVFRMGNTFYRKSSDGGANFDPIIPVLSDTPANTTTFGEFTLDSSGNPYIAFTDYDGVTDVDMFFYNSTDGGASLSAPSELESGVELLKSPKYMVIDIYDNPHLIYNTATLAATDYKLYHRSSEDDGLSYGDPARLDNETGNSIDAVEVVYR